MAQKNRLNLDFSLQTNIERKEFLEKYLQSEMFQNRPPDEDELATMADYVLWGKDPITGKNGKQQGLDLRTKHGTWDNSDNTESLEQLMEQPTFNENGLSALGTTQYRVKKEVFSREEAIASAPPAILPSLLTLFAEIDRTDLLCEEYDLLHGKRTKPIRASLINKFDEEELCRMRETVTHWNQAKYLKHRHLLVELRREQYTLRDSYRKIIFSEADATPEAEPIELGTDVNILPLGLYDKGEIAPFVFRTLRGLDPNTYDESVLEQISHLYWKKKQFAPSPYEKWFDFRDAEHVYQLLNSEQELSVIAEEDDTAPLSHLMRTLQFYIRQAELPDIQSEILTMKLKKEKNTDIAYYINHKYGKSYTPNYISTIFKQKIVVKIAEAARMHEEIIANVFFPENFKQCSCCGTMLLRCPDNFTRKGRATDGYAARCKICEKKARKGEE